MYFSMIKGVRYFVVSRLKIKIKKKNITIKITRFLILFRLKELWIYMKRLWYFIVLRLIATKKMRVIISDVDFVISCKN